MINFFLSLFLSGGAPPPPPIVIGDCDVAVPGAFNRDDQYINGEFCDD